MVKTEYEGFGGGGPLGWEEPVEVHYCDRCGKLAQLRDPFEEEDYCNECAKKRMADIIKDMNISEMAELLKFESVN